MIKIVFLSFILVLAGCSRSFFSHNTSPDIKYHNKRYIIIQAGEQSWMAENLATSTYRYGKKIPVIKDYNIWPEMKTPGCGYYKNDSSMLRKYGMLYNWYAVDGGKLCPMGWRVATHQDWNKLEEFLGGQFRSGGKMKAVAGWKYRHISGDDIGFKALPGGYRLNDDFLEGAEAIWWSSSVAMNTDFQKGKLSEEYKSLAENKDYVWGRKIVYNSTYLYSTLNKRENGFSVRCVSGKKVK